MAKLASKVVEQAKAWLGFNEADGSHRQILAVYNNHKPLARGYAVQPDDAWCATFVSAVAVKLGYTDIIPTECSCTKMIELLQARGSWDENDARTPKPGDILFYDWDDNGSGDNRGGPEHVGIVEKVTGNKVTIIEGNYSNSVKRRTLSVNGKYIRGYGVPKYDAATEPAAKPAAKPAEKKEEGYKMNLRILRKGCTGDDVRALQILLKGYGYNCGTVDGIFGSNTDSKVRAYQKDHGLPVDGEAGPDTMGSLLGV